ncbi:MAG: glycosyltransferase, partial [Anaerolineae bacterium]|nr:glycosyltransferase [Anaerolineae bacterium]
MTLAAIILTRNEERHIAECISSLKWADYILVFDSGSTDRTREIAENSGAEVRVNEFSHYAQQRNDAFNAVQTD